MSRNWKYIREALFEFHRVGAYVRVTAIDPDSGIEISVPGAASASTAELKALAGQKLDYVVGKKIEEMRANQGRSRGFLA